MSDLTLDISEFHWALQVMDNMDAGLVVLDTNYKVCTWNSFMQSYSGITADIIMGHNLFDLFPQLPSEWLKAKIEASIKLKMRGFSSWEDRPYLFEFNNFSPVSNGLAVMYQNVVITPLRALTGEVTHVCLMIHDVSDIAKKKLHLRETNQKLSHLSRTDGLTGLYNRAHWEQCLSDQFIQCQTLNTPASLVIFDIDHFKKVNDTYGHSSGDGVIRQTAHLLKKTARQADCCGRYGGEEFTVLLPNTNSEQAHYFSERLRQRIEETAVSTEQGDISFTISLGISEFHPEMETYLAWLECADKALYSSKQNGRNQSTIHD
ncbi:putative GGDEF and PAS/PAC family protein [Vibrio nigripulchritudo SFn27]|uniref:diguanylate cyclase n=1 Tax=Vibrio nigripulchritudo TaxID=28173 RepID=U4KBP7_9VIBR|nr:diguanylate cyclase [Vibrio nigripulchritudo]CCN82950.1 putative GGDEF and PAS/PAC family protein [Vibrio nigripulchritudo BLFn1]CCN88551.1 putative GGDEF and PAS/PAC family protein [Vibrio nigripulchritudo SFn27]CCN96764.1 putative GGDEF and PAS/PAC family protein [Vibrio nigripulchritudo ENn2]CCO42081.1 putative GGDEF and PAS/PAC family protein [Vibrio nigripulchritudo SFn135]CCO55899.1 putative GGDEF and PAS/PAC family protein [Vibrio nigripulchritudo Wn13]